MTIVSPLYKFIFLYFFIFAIHDFSLAQIKTKGIPYINNYSTNDYKGAPDCWQITQDKRGVMYFGNHGLLQFDGTTWELFPIPNNTIVRTVAIDKTGKIYVGAQGEFGYFLPDSCGSLTYFSLSDKLPKEEKRNVNDIWRIFFTDNDEIIFQDRYAFFTYKNGKFKVVKSAAWMSFAYEVKKKIYLGIENVGLHEFKDGQLQLVKNGGYFKGSKIVSILPYDDHQLLIVNEKEGLTLYDGNKFTLWKTEVNKFVLSNVVMNAIKLQDGYFALGSWVNGLLIFDKHGNPIQHLNKGKGLQSNLVFGLHQDVHKNLWITTSNGINHIEINSPYTYYNEFVGAGGAAYGSAIYDNKIFLATNLGISWDEWQDYTNPLGSQANFNWVKNLRSQSWNVEVVDNHLLAEMDLGLYTIEDSLATPVKSLNGVWKVIQLNNYPGYYLKGCYTGLVLYKKEKGKIEFVKKLKNFEESSRVIEQDKDGTIWVSHAYKGVYKIVLDKDTKEIVSEKFYNSSQGLPTDVSIHVFKINNEIVFSSPKGIYQFKSNADRFEPSEK
jgi:ligand-binding sensor domain-containing protein